MQCGVVTFCRNPTSRLTESSAQRAHFAAAGFSLFVVFVPISAAFFAMFSLSLLFSPLLAAASLSALCTFVTLRLIVDGYACRAAPDTPKGLRAALVAPVAVDGNDAIVCVSRHKPAPTPAPHALLQASKVRFFPPSIFHVSCLSLPLFLFYFATVASHGFRSVS